MGGGINASFINAFNTLWVYNGFTSTKYTMGLSVQRDAKIDFSVFNTIANKLTEWEQLTFTCGLFSSMSCNKDAIDPLNPRRVNFWYPYGSNPYSETSEQYVYFNDGSRYFTLNIGLKSWSGCYAFMTTNKVNFTPYKYINIKYDYYMYQSSVYNNQFRMGICSAVPDYIYENNPISVICDNTLAREWVLFEYDKSKNTVWRTETKKYDISDISGSYYIWLASVTWSLWDDYNKIKVSQLSLTTK